MSAKSIFSLEFTKYSNIDSRLKKYLKSWKLIEQYKGKTVTIPNDWNSDIFPTKYFEVVKQPSDDNYRPGGEEDEIGLVMEAGWKGYDTECIINLFILGSDVKLQNGGKVSAEILKAGGAPMKLYYNDKLVTDFTKSVWWHWEESPKVWIDDMRVFA